MDKELKSYRKHLLNIFEKSQDNFEKQLSFISAGALGISIGFINKIIPNVYQANYKYLLMIAWGLLSLTFIINLLSHISSVKETNKIIKSIDEDEYDRKKAIKRIRKINCLNTFSIGSLICGITCLLLFISLNILKMENKKLENNLTIKGLIPASPPKPKILQSPKPKNSAEGEKSM